jgi:glycosyltransferase involved in cell wall biosynthesis
MMLSNMTLSNMTLSNMTPDTATPETRLRVAYIMSRFPKLTETFVLYEILAMEGQDVDVAIYPLLRERPGVIHEDARQLVARANYTPLLSLPIIGANLRRLLRQPRAYLGTLIDVVRGTWGSLRFLAGGLIFFPKAVYMAQHMEQEGIRHIHAHFASHPAAVAFVIHRLNGIPYSFTAHGSDIHRDQHMLREKVAEAAFVVPISVANRDFILERIGNESSNSAHTYADKMVVIHCGVDMSQFASHFPSPNGHSASTDDGLSHAVGMEPPSSAAIPTAQEADPAATGLGAEPFHILCIGTLHEVKGQTYLIAAVEQLRRQEIDVHCHFVGGGPDRPRLQQQVDELGLGARVHFHGEQTRSQVLDHLRRADVIVLPSVPSSDGRREGIPVSLMEGMAAGLPVVASRLSGIPELVEDGQTGLLADPRDVDGLAAALARLHRSAPLRRRLGQAGRQKVLAEFDLYENARQLANQIREVLA